MGSAGLIALEALLSCSGNEFSAGANSAGTRDGEDGGAEGNETTAGRRGSSEGGSNGGHGGSRTTLGGRSGDAGEPGTVSGSASGGTTNNAGESAGGAAGTFAGTAQGRITAAPYFACAIRSDGSIACWGQKTEAPTGRFDSISSGGEGEISACALSGTKAICWGGNSNGQAGERATPYKAVAAGGIFNCGIRSVDSKAECWGIGFAANYMFEGAAVAVTAGVPAVCALFTDGRIDCRGGEGPNWTTPAGTFTSVSAGEHYACAIRDDSSIVCWGGSNRAGEESAPSGSFIAVSAGNTHSCAIRSDNTVVCWGDDRFGQSSPPPDKFVAIAASLYTLYTCGIRVDGSIACWGYNEDGQAKPPSGSFLPP